MANMDRPIRFDHVRHERASRIKRWKPPRRPKLTTVLNKAVAIHPQLCVGLCLTVPAILIDTQPVIAAL